MVSFGLKEKAIDPALPFINIDLIVSHEFGGYTVENITKAQGIAGERMRKLLDQQKDFMIESNLSKSSDDE